MEPAPLGAAAAETVGLADSVQVLLPEPVGLLDYALPAELAGSVQPGMAVRLPLGSRETYGYVVAVRVQTATGRRLRPIADLEEGLPALPPLLLNLLQFAADYYAVAPGEMLRAALPSFAKPAPLQLRLAPAGAAALADDPGLPPIDRALLQHLADQARPCGITALVQVAGERRSAVLARLRRLRLAERVVPHSRQSRPRLDTLLARLPGADPSCLTARQAGARALWEALPAAGTLLLSSLRQAMPRAPAQLQVLLKARLVRAQTVPYGGLAPPHRAVAPPPEPTAAQAAALVPLCAALAARQFAPFLLQGITGSGKTEVYLRLIAEALAQDRSALVLVPEIALTPQLGAQFRGRFGARVAIFHSGLGQAERRAEWERVARGEAQIGLGARSALFLPLRRLGVLIVDEEHETSFKQEETPRYNARDLAVVRARLEQAVVVLGSATPSLESHANAEAGRYTRLRLQARVANRPLPEVACIQLGKDSPPGEVLSAPLLAALRATVAAGDQAILFLNRRGYAPYVFCHDCGHSYRCQECDVALTLHRGRGMLLCHYCGHHGAAPSTCSACGSGEVGAFGLGTERIEAEVRRLLGDGIGVVRLDRDVVRQRDDLEQVLDTFRSGRAAVMVGTQMVAKGHDFPNVTLVGVLAADASLNFPDFRAAERTFQLLTQVAGRAGRGDRPGRVLLQAFDPDHYAIRCACRHDFDAFVAEEAMARKELDYPPYARLALLRWEGPEEADVQRQAEQEAELLRQAEASTVHVLGPAPAPIARLRGLWRMQLLLKSRSRTALHALVRLLPRPRADAPVRRILDIDPVSML